MYLNYSKIIECILKSMRKNSKQVFITHYNDYGFDLKFNDITITWFPPEMDRLDSVQLVVTKKFKNEPYIIDTGKIYSTEIVDSVLGFYNQLIHPERLTWRYKLIETPIMFLKRLRLKYIYGYNI